MTALKNEELESWLEQLRAEGTSLLECVRKVCSRCGVGLGEARDVVVESRAWASDREAFEQLNARFFEILSMSDDEIEALEAKLEREDAAKQEQP
jgi:hypothetical protein